MVNRSNNKSKSTRSNSNMRDRADTAHAKSARETVKTSVRTKARRTAAIDSAGFDIDPELLDESYNQTRRPLLPYGIVVNDKPAGILIPTDQLEKADWLTLPEEDELTTVSLTEDVTGLLITEARMLVLAYVPEYIRYKSDIDEVGGTMVGLYDEYRNAFDKKTMDACSEHALVFLDENNQPLHTTAIVVRFKNVALWSFKSAREDYYRQLEKAFAEFAGRKYSGKNDKWRSLGVLEVTFKAAKEGEGSNKSWCCKTESITTPTKENFPQLFLGTATDKTVIWGVHDAIAGFTETQSLPALPGEMDTVQTEVLPSAASDRKLKNAQFVETEEISDEIDDELDDDFLEVEAEEVDDLDEDDFDDDEED